MKKFLSHLSWDGWDDDLYYLYWWNWLPKKSRYIGIESVYYDGPHWTLGLWFVNISWRFPCNNWDADKMWNFRLPRDWRSKEHS